MIFYATTLDDKERFELLCEDLMDATEDEDWEKVSSLISVNPDFMEYGMETAYGALPDEYKYSIPMDCYIHNGDRMPIVRKYVQRAIQYAPLEKRIPAEMISLKEIEVYRAGMEPIEQAQHRISWTTSLAVAQWFYDRANFRHCPCHLYKGIITPEKIICFTDNRQEKEVMQYGSVTNIVEIER